MIYVIGMLFGMITITVSLNLILYSFINDISRKWLILAIPIMCLSCLLEIYCSNIISVLATNIC